MKRPKKIILVSIDTLRADHLGCYGYKRDTSPFMDRFSKECTFFKWAFSSCSYTVPSHASIFTGKYPSKHTFGFANSNVTFYQPDSELMLQEVLDAEGYESAAFVSALPLRREIGFQTGFKFYDDNLTKREINRPDELFRRGKETNERAFEWLDKNQNINFFLFIHYFDVHGPYTNPEGFKEIFLNDNSYGEEVILEVKEENVPIGGIPAYQFLKPVRDKNGNLLSYQKDAKYYIAEYDAGIRYVDSILEQLIYTLKALDIYEDCLIFITSDHGEAFGENNVWFFHGLTATPDLIHVPLLIKPHKEWGIKQETINTHVTLVDLFPTICDLIGFDYSDLDFDGNTLIKVMENGKDVALESRIFISEIEGQIAYIDKQNINIKPKHVKKDRMVFLYAEELCNKEFTINYRTKMPLIEFTGERYVPWADDPTISYEHIHRYGFAKQFVKGKKVLDLACGEGYGSFILHEDADFVIGIDIDNTVIEHASNKYDRNNLKFITGSITKVPLNGENLFDVIICFEALEHITEHTNLVKEVKRLLKQDGILIISTPDKAMHSDDPSYKNPFHVKELYFDEFRELLLLYFKNMILYGQDIYPSSNIFPLYEVPMVSKYLSIEQNNGVFRFLPIKSKMGKYFIAITSDASLDPKKFSVNSHLVDISKALFDQKDEQISILEEVVKNRDTHISNLEIIVNDYKQKVQETPNLMQKINAMLPALETTLTSLSKENISSGSSIRLGELCLSIGNMSKAKYFFEKALSIDPRNDEAINNLGVLSHRLGDSQEAMDFFVKALKLNPNNADAKTNLALLFEREEIGIE